ncbi:AraC-like DNA-binding protein [Sinobaca qinghaiensis]|uniref:AraC-like DNA-binding protein n=1 Tax=Sinobaca qinghaiensis TaxID=342944 RepID=A0A419V069_9BACL|nr:helix-turn-helix domain-containing protein [Sinobaca qinghaiensis]RKD71344.1 AraC-like DNA-binding protein [Sinobaca qinghaiensis]
MTDIKKFCEYLYKSSFVPVYLYDNNELITCYPDQKEDTLPPSRYLSKLKETDKTVTYTSTTFYSHYGCIHIENSSSFIVLGPINDFPYSYESLALMHREFAADESSTEAFSEFFHGIPTENLDTFINTLLFINYTINHSELTRKDIEDDISVPFESSIAEKYSIESFLYKEEGFFDNNFQIEREFIRYIETGNIDKLNEIHTISRNTKIGVIANNKLRQWKNTFIVTVTLSSRAAMRGGLAPSIAYQLSNIYINQVERLTELDAIMSLLSQVQIDYANRVANSIVPATADIILRQVIEYVHENTNQNIKTADVADHVGFTRSYLSRKFKKEMGMELSHFIRKCKLEEARDMLAFSDKTISEISSDLCFSSQSHFQKSFKDTYEMTPQTYRNSL